VTPVRTYRPVGETDRHIWHHRGDLHQHRSVEAMWNLWQTLARPTSPPGVQRRRSIEETAERRRPWERRNIERPQRDHHPR